MIVAPAVLSAALVVVAAPGGAQVGKPGFFPRPLFRTPASAAYCYADLTGFEDGRASLTCWTPNDGFGVSIPWNGRRANTAYHNHPPRTGEDFGDLRGYAPFALTLRYGQTWRYRCADPGNQRTCHVGGSGVTAFTCVSRVSGLTCTNAARHGWWIGRYRGYRLL